MKTFSFLTVLLLLLFAMDKNTPTAPDDPEPALNMLYVLRKIPVGWENEKQSQTYPILCAKPQKRHLKF